MRILTTAMMQRCFHSNLGHPTGWMPRSGVTDCIRTLAQVALGKYADNECKLRRAECLDADFDA